MDYLMALFFLHFKVPQESILYGQMELAGYIHTLTTTQISKDTVPVPAPKSDPVPVQVF
jgi:hypothetical protein